MAAKLQDQVAYPPRAMRAERAAAYLDMSMSKFLKLVEERRMPEPVRIDGVVTWDRVELEAAYETFKAADRRTPPADQPRRNSILAKLGVTDDDN